MIRAVTVAFVAAWPTLANAQALAGKTITYTSLNGGASGYIFIAKSGTIYWGVATDFSSKQQGLRLRLGKTVSEQAHGCTWENHAALSGNVLTLTSHAICPAYSSKSIATMTVQMSGATCSTTYTVRFIEHSAGPGTHTFGSETCRIVEGNEIAR